MLFGFTDFMSRTGGGSPARGRRCSASLGFAVFGGKRGKTRRDTLLLSAGVRRPVSPDGGRAVLPGAGGAGSDGRAATRRRAGLGRQHEQCGLPSEAGDRSRSDDARRRPRPADPGVGHLPARRPPDDPRRREHRIAGHAAGERSRCSTSANSDTSSKRLTDMFEPAIILVVGGMVAFVAVAQISAMYSIYSQVKI